MAATRARAPSLSIPRGLRVSHTRVGKTSMVVLSWPLAKSPSLPSAIARAPLTGAERDVLAYTLDGRSNDEIAVLRGASLGTVKKQLASAYRKLGIRSRSELAALSRHADE